MDGDIEKEPFLAAPVESSTSSGSNRRTKRFLAVLGHVLVSISLATLMCLASTIIFKASGGGQDVITLFDNTVIPKEITIPRPDLWDNSVFRSGIGNESEANRAWAQLLHLSGMRITDAEAEALGIVSLPLLGDTQGAAMAVWHNLHCIDAIRRFIRDFNSVLPDEYAGTPHDHKQYLQRLNHSFHCLELLRNSVMCQPDVNVQHLSWVGTDKREYAAKSDSPRRCMKWDAFSEWTESRNIHRIEYWKVVDKV